MEFCKDPAVVQESFVPFLSSPCPVASLNSQSSEPGKMLVAFHVTTLESQHTSCCAHSQATLSKSIT